EIGPAIPPLPDSMAYADFSPDGKLVAAAVGKAAKIWDGSQLAQLAMLEGHLDWIEGLAFTSNARDIFTWTRDGTVNRWRPDGGLVYSIAANTAQDPYDARIISLSVSANGKRFASVGWDYTARVWDAETGKQISMARDPQGTLRWVSLSPDGTTLVS